MSRVPDAIGVRVQRVVEHKLLVGGAAELEELLGRLLRCQDADPEPPVPKTLDLIGHSTPSTSLLQLGDWVIDGMDSNVVALFHRLATNRTLPRLGVHGVRLLGCNTAETSEGRATLDSLAKTLDLDVFGSVGFLFASHYVPDGFSDDWRFLLRAAHDLHDNPSENPQRVRRLDLETLPALAVSTAARAGPYRFVTNDIARRILAVIRGDAGAAMVGPALQSDYQIAVPSLQPRHHHIIDVLLAGRFVRVYPDGHEHPGILFPVADPAALGALVDELPLT